MSNEKWRGTCNQCPWTSTWYWDPAYAYWELHEHESTNHGVKTTGLESQRP